MEELDSFDALVQAARMQPEGQRFLMVFVKTELPSAVNGAQVARFEAGMGGALVPVMYVDKGRYEVNGFDALVAEAEQTGKTLGKDNLSSEWDMVIVGCLGGYGGREPTAADAEQPLQNLLQAIRAGRSLMHLAAFDRNGDPVRFQ
ncbi:MAG TPA: ribonucleotide reductase subunit alpha [Oleiagrimonas sp.]|nr:ribonucleotide reductase subunit alpha [Oleiagrimonas sp.]